MKYIKLGLIASVIGVSSAANAIEVGISSNPALVIHHDFDAELLVHLSHGFHAGAYGAVRQPVRFWYDGKSSADYNELRGGIAARYYPIEPDRGLYLSTRLHVESVQINGAEINYKTDPNSFTKCSASSKELGFAALLGYRWLSQKRLTLDIAAGYYDSGHHNNRPTCEQTWNSSDIDEMFYVSGFTADLRFGFLF